MRCFSCCWCLLTPPPSCQCDAVCQGPSPSARRGARWLVRQKSARSMTAMRLLIICAWVWPRAVGAARSHSWLAPLGLVSFPLDGCVACGPSWTHVAKVGPDASHWGSVDGHRFVKHTFYCSRTPLCILQCSARPNKRQCRVCCFAGRRAAYCWGRLALAGQIEHLRASLENKCGSQLSVVLGLCLGFAWRLQVRTAGEKGLSGTLSLQQWHGWGGGQVPRDGEFAAGSPGC